ncbi:MULTISPECIES: ABC transporter ATP-binding protein [Methylomonas]|uniref:ABC transporter n=1 Tax=Methylomonas koyamae TaxID=702114 RepID=A0A177NW98_9GAMM|nr:MULTISPECIES: ABC transporter ATP-binding protein [Methylomonas]ANE55779.1 ABC transporter [Methylomonas sp. DH-1]ATG90639.1 putative ABC transport system ATP-binding protein [Methylomonas koyamae]OAI12225.1 ABC transporter [Methylomonas koyamae]OAI22288.1 ABC transporter [Methylomonas koyamae]WNB77744.1 ABC transporter ATP-binding protein [Methylomonas koyamae]
MTQPIIKLEHISKSYGHGDGAVTVLQDLSLSIQQGEFTCIWGASGSGKSTLLNLMGLLDRPEQGRITIKNEAVLGLNDNRLADFRSRHLGFIFQSFNLVPVLSAQENTMLPLQIRGEADNTARRKARDLLAELGLERHLHKRPDEMSGGQRQRVAIARALIGDPDIVLADEPTANLDSANSDAIILLMQKLNQKRKVTFLFATHDTHLLSYAARSIQVRDGRIVDDRHNTYLREAS